MAQYTTRGELTQRLCGEIGWRPEINAIETMTRDGQVFVRGTAIKPDEARSLAAFCEARGYRYRGPKVR